MGVRITRDQLGPLCQAQYDAVMRRRGVKAASKTGAKRRRRVYDFAPIFKADIPNRTVTFYGWDALSFANTAIHRMAKAKRAKMEVRAAHMGMSTLGHIVADRFRVTFTRYGTKLLDDDNIRSAFKHARDGVAAWLGIDDADPRIIWEYAPQQQCKRGQQKIVIKVESV